jgi:dihydrolipoamide dehydrogenase
MQTFDLVIIGSGPGGYRAAVLAALAGLKTAIVEKSDWGGTCLNRGCVPKKAWYATARLLAARDGLGERGIAGELAPDVPAAWRHQRRVVETVRASYVDYLKRLGVTRFTGAARFTGPRRVAVGAETLEVAHVIVATGADAYVPPQLPRASGRILTTDDLFDAPAPAGRRVAVIGSGVVGTEMAFILRLLGHDVVWLMHGAPLARAGYSAPALRLLREALAGHGIAARTGCRVRSTRLEPGGVALELPDGTVERVDWVLLGSGRVPHTASLELAGAGIETDDRGFVRVDERQQTSRPGIYAIGDVANPAMTSNHALADAAVALANIVRPGSRVRRDEAVPVAVYSAVELARIGLNEDEAEDRGLEPAIGFASFEASPAALAEGDARGFVRIVSDMDTGTLLGAELAGGDAAELVHVLGLDFGDPDALARIARMPFNHPTRAEEILNATETLAAKWGLAGRILGLQRE